MILAKYLKTGVFYNMQEVWFMGKGTKFIVSEHHARPCGRCGMSVGHLQYLDGDIFAKISV